MSTSATATFAPAPLERPARLLTFALVLLIGVLVPALLVAASPAAERPATAAVLGVAAWLIVLAAWGATPAAFELDGATLRVRRRVLPAVGYRLRGDVRRAPATLGLGGRMIGSAGAFGWSGWTWRPGLGVYRAYLTDRSRIVLCDTEDGLVLVTPADPDGFRHAANEGRR